MSFNKNIVLSFYNEIEQDKYHRYKSWEHCFKVFQKETNTDTLALHLAFYLASWGMYRGSSGLLQKDYKVHIPAVEIILHSKYNTIRCFNNETDISSKDIPLVLELKEELLEYYKSIKFIRQGKCFSVTPTDTLLTKIMLGTTGSIPAYDRFFNLGLSKYKICKKFNEESLYQMFEFIEQDNNRESINQLQKEITNKNLYYPTMKLLDMFFWSVGYVIDIQKKNKKIKIVEGEVL